MSDSDVHDNEMDGPHDFDDVSTEALIEGSGHDVDPALADLLGDMRVAYVSTSPAVGAELAALIGSPVPAAAPSPRRFTRMRPSIIAKIGAAAAAVFAASGGLAVAGALPAPVQDAISHIGIGASTSSGHHHHSAVETSDSGDTTTTVDTTAPTSVPAAATPTTETENHGSEVSGVAHDSSTTGCEHGHAVAAVASGGKSQGQPCPDTRPTVGDGTTPTSVDENHDGTGDDNEPGNSQGATTTSRATAIATTATARRPRRSHLRTVVTTTAATATAAPTMGATRRAATTVARAAEATAAPPAATESTTANPPFAVRMRPAPNVGAGRVACCGTFRGHALRSLTGSGTQHVDVEPCWRDLDDAI